MARTAQLGLPLVLPSQAQKHVTVNEALVRIDAATQLSVRSAAEQAPPASPSEGDIYVIASGASGAWSGRAGEIAIWSNGGWVFLSLARDGGPGTRRRPRRFFMMERPGSLERLRSLPGGPRRATSSSSSITSLLRVQQA